MMYYSTWEDFESITIFGTVASSSFLTIIGIASLAMFVNMEGVQSIEFL